MKDEDGEMKDEEGEEEDYEDEIEMSVNTLFKRPVVNKAPNRSGFQEWFETAFSS